MTFIDFRDFNDDNITFYDTSMYLLFLLCVIIFIFIKIWFDKSNINLISNETQTNNIDLLSTEIQTDNIIMITNETQTSNINLISNETQTDNIIMITNETQTDELNNNKIIDIDYDYFTKKNN
jgi:hypothetical protein